MFRGQFAFREVVLWVWSTTRFFKRSPRISGLSLTFPVQGSMVKLPCHPCKMTQYIRWKKGHRPEARMIWDGSWRVGQWQEQIWNNAMASCLFLTQLPPWTSSLVSTHAGSQTKSPSCVQPRGLQNRQKPKIHQPQACAWGANGHLLSNVEVMVSLMLYGAPLHSCQPTKRRRGWIITLKPDQILNTSMLSSVIVRRQCWLTLENLGWTSATLAIPEPVQGVHMHIYV